MSIREMTNQTKQSKKGKLVIALALFAGKSLKESKQVLLRFARIMTEIS